jgi:soluble lytic murein transglycosylase
MRISRNLATMMLLLAAPVARVAPGLDEPFSAAHAAGSLEWRGDAAVPFALMDPELEPPAEGLDPLLTPPAAQPGIAAEGDRSDVTGSIAPRTTSPELVKPALPVPFVAPRADDSAPSAPLEDPIVAPHASLDVPGDFAEFDPGANGAPAASEAMIAPDPAPAAQDAASPRVGAVQGGEQVLVYAQLLAAAALYQKGDLAGGDAIAKVIGDPAQRLALEWVALKSAPRAAGLARIGAFLEAHPGWPARDWLRSWREAILFADHADPARIRSEFETEKPASALGSLALARVALVQGRPEDARALVASVWRGGPLDPWLEGAVLREFGSLLSAVDHKVRAARLFYQEHVGAASRAAALAGPDSAALVRTALAASQHPLPDDAVAALPPALRGDPLFLFGRVQGLRRADRVIEAATLLDSAPASPEALVEPDAWWAERRMIARRLLDFGFYRQAYAICAQNSAQSHEARVDAEFHAGWIALRFNRDAAAAARHFAAAAAAADTPLSIARAAYWQGRAAEAQNAPARDFFERAAAFPIAYYGQLAAQKLDAAPPRLRGAAPAPLGESRAEATRTIELLYAAKLDAYGDSLALDAAKNYDDEAQLAALGDILARNNNAPASLIIGKLATIRGFALDRAAFPTFGIPAFAPLAVSAELPEVYAVARQESEFIWRAASGAGAKGLMQILPGTARETARRAGVAFDPGRLISDPAFNTQLGAAFLGEMLADEGGSAPLAYAAYNAGPGRVAQWLKAYGDPRRGDIDMVDWIERIPFDETRDYVQRVSENAGVYRARFAELEARRPVEVARAAQ